MSARLTWLPATVLFFSVFTPHMGKHIFTRPTTISIVADSGAADTTQVHLTEALLVQYIAAKKALTPFWNTHRDLLSTARATAQRIMIEVPGGEEQPVVMFDYPALAAQEPALATLFRQCTLQPEQFAQIQVTVYKALYEIAAGDGGKAIAAKSGSVGKNVKLVRAHQQGLAAVGVTAQAGQKSGGAQAPSGTAVAVGRAAPQLAVSKWINLPAAGARPKFGDGHVYVVDFTAEWCGSCHAVYPVIESLQKRYAVQGVRIVYATALWGMYGGRQDVPAAAELDSLKQYFPALHVTGPVAIFDRPMGVLKSGYFQGSSLNLPRVVVIDGQGILRAVTRDGWGAAQGKQVINAVTEALRSGPTPTPEASANHP